MALSDDPITLAKQINGQAMSGLRNPTNANLRARIDWCAILSHHLIDVLAPPTPPPPPPPEPPPSGAFNDHPANIAHWLLAGDDTEPMPTVTNAPDGTPGVHFRIPAGGASRDSQRQFVMPKNPAGGTFWYREGDVGDFRFRYFLLSYAPADWYDLTQWFDESVWASPPVELGIPGWTGDGHFYISGGYGSPKGDLSDHRDLGQVVLGRWINWRVRILFSTDPAVGTVDVWRDGTQVVSGWHPRGATQYVGPSKIETGIYRATVSGSAEMWQEGWAF